MDATSPLRLSAVYPLSCQWLMHHDQLCQTVAPLAAHKFNFPQGNAGKTVLVESLVQRGYVEPYDDERVG